MENSPAFLTLGTMRFSVKSHRDDREFLSSLAGLDLHFITKPSVLNAGLLPSLYHGCPWRIFRGAPDVESNRRTDQRGVFAAAADDWWGQFASVGSPQ